MVNVCILGRLGGLVLGSFTVGLESESGAGGIKGDPESALFAWFFNVGKR